MLSDKDIINIIETILREAEKEVEEVPMIDILGSITLSLRAGGLESMNGNYKGEGYVNIVNEAKDAFCFIQDPITVWKFEDN